MGEERQPDFSGYATKVGLKCSDGRTIMPGAFEHQNGATVPLVWQHNHKEPENVLGHAVLEHRQDGVYAYGFFNGTPTAQNAKTLVSHGDIKSLSIYANQLTEKSKQVIHGMIRELSLVLSGANPGAFIDNITLAHDDGDMVTLEDEAVIYTGLDLVHADAATTEPDPGSVDLVPDADEPGSMQEIYNSMTTEQKDLCHYMVGAAIEASSGVDIAHSDDNNTADNGRDGRRMTRNVFEQHGKGGATTDPTAPTLSHDDMHGIIEDAKKMGSLKAAVEGYALSHGIESIDLLFPEVKAITNTPEFDSRRIEWVRGVLAGTRHSPFTRIKSLVADLTFDEARAKGYVKGNLKKEEFISISKRITTPSTIYKKQKLDRDDILDITDFNVVVWLQGEMRLMLDEELARAILIGDGREVDDEDKILDPAGSSQGAGIRSILNDHDLYSATVNVNTDAEGAGQFTIIDSVVDAMRFYKGSGSPTFYTTLPAINKILMQRDTLGRRIYASRAAIATEMGVADIVPVQVMEDVPDLIGIIVNLADYTIGTDAGGEINFFDFFDIDYNQYKYLLETRVSGALTKIRSALVVKRVAGTDVLAAPVSPAYDAETGIITPATTTGVTYKRSDTNATVTAEAPITLGSGESLKIYALPASGYYFATNEQDEWTFSNNA